jgi:hypothetical protein
MRWLLLLLLLSSCATRPPAPFETLRDCDHYCDHVFTRCQAQEKREAAELECGDRYVGCLRGCGY